jgi:PD-(D/E)XK nuclease superfamily protein
MRIDNSAATTWQFCPLKYYEKYVAKREFPDEGGSRAFGSRMHALLGEYHGTLAVPRIDVAPGVPCEDPQLEAEAQATFARYLGHYPYEPFDFGGVEAVHVIPLPHSDHELVVKIDGWLVDQEGRTGIYECKTEKRGSQANNPESWASRSQVGLYQWALSHVLQREVDYILLDVITRQSEKGRVSADFRRDRLQRNLRQQELALDNIRWVADQIEAMEKSGFWASNTNNCKQGWLKCDYYLAHLEGWTDDLLRRTKPAEDYLGL